MDELEFRRRIYADPDTTDPAVLKAAENDPEKRTFRDQMRRMNNELKQAAKMPVPDDLAHKLIWQQATNDFVQQRKKHRWYTALAASVALMVGIISTLWFVQRPANIETQALAHVVHMEKELPHSAVAVDIAQINAKLASFGGHLASSIGDVEVVNFCHLETIRSLHLILNTDQGKISVFVIPQDKAGDLPNRFGNSQFEGTGFGLQKASVLVVGAKGANLLPLTEKVKKSIQFSA